MNKEGEDKLVNATIDLHQEIKGLRGDMDNQLAKVNLGLGELRLSYMKLEERLEVSINGLRKGLHSDINRLRTDFNKYADSNNALIQNHETRITHLEDKSGGAYIAREPKDGIRKGRKNNYIGERKNLQKRFS